MDEYLIFLDVTSEHRYLGHTSGGEQSGTEGPVSQCPEVQHRGTVGGQGHYQQLSEDGGLGAEGRGSGVLRQVVGGCGRGQLLGYNLAGKVDISAPVELYPYYGESVGRGGTHPAHSGGAVDGRLDGEGHELLYFLRGHAARLGHDDYCRGIEVGEDVYLRVEGPV